MEHSFFFAFPDPKKEAKTAPLKPFVNKELAVGNQEKIAYCV